MENFKLIKKDMIKWIECDKKDEAQVFTFNMVEKAVSKHIKFNYKGEDLYLANRMLKYASKMAKHNIAQTLMYSDIDTFEMDMSLMPHVAMAEEVRIIKNFNDFEIKLESAGMKQYKYKGKGNSR